MPNREVPLFRRRIRVLVQNNKIKNFQEANLVLVKHASLLEKEGGREGTPQHVYSLACASHLHTPSAALLHSQAVPAAEDGAGPGKPLSAPCRCHSISSLLLQDQVPEPMPLLRGTRARM